jgi:hypothetical protein
MQPAVAATDPSAIASMDTPVSINQPMEAGANAVANTASPVVRARIAPMWRTP